MLCRDVCFNEINGNPNLRGFCQGEHKSLSLFVGAKADFEILQITFCTFDVRVMLVSKNFYSQMKTFQETE